jgi:hypothetical protein
MQGSSRSNKMEQREFFTDYGEANRWVLLGSEGDCPAAMQDLHCGLDSY